MIGEPPFTIVFKKLIIQYDSPFQEQKIHEYRKLCRTFNIIISFSVAVVTAFFVCWAPFHAQRLLAVYLSSASREFQQNFFDLYRYLMYTSGVLYYISTTINPVLYHIMSRKFRKAFKVNLFLINQQINELVDMLSAVFLPQQAIITF